MMIGRIKIIYDQFQPRPTKREFQKLMKEMYFQLGRFWHWKLRKKHFTKRGATEYGYTPRGGERGNPGKQGFKRSYTGRKLKLRGHTKPIFWFGKTKRLSASRRVIATSKGAKVILSQLRYLNRYVKHRKDGTVVNPGADLTRVSKGDFRQMSNIGRRFIAKEMTKKTGRKVWAFG